MNLLFNVSEIKALLKNYYNLTRIRVAIFDSEFHEIIAYPPRLSEFCQIIRSDAKVYKNCIASDYRAFQTCQKSTALHCYTCHAGLREAIVPVISAEESIVAYIMIGQVLEEQSRKSSWENIVQRLQEHSINWEKLHSAFEKKQNVEATVLESSLHMLEICASYLHDGQKIRLKEDSLAHKIDTFIEKNLRKELSATFLCHNLHLCKTKLYETSKEIYGMGISEHIRHVRVQRAKEYLVKTDLLIYEIADKVGIPDYNYFSKVFKKIVGVNPHVYRKQNKFVSFDHLA